MAKSRLKVFISQSHKDDRLADAVTDLLKETFRLSSKEIRCTSLPQYGFKPGSNIEHEILQDVESSEVVIVLITPNSLSNEWVHSEVGATKALKRPLFPLLAGVDGTQLKGFLRSVNSLSADNMDQLNFFLESCSRTFNLKTQKWSSDKLIKRLKSKVIKLANKTRNNKEATTQSYKTPKILRKKIQAQATVDAAGGLQTSRIFLKKGQKFLLEPEGRIHLASDQVDNFARALKPLIVKHADGWGWTKEIKDRYKPKEPVEETIFYRGWIGPEGEVQSSDMLEKCKLRPTEKWGALLAVILPVKASSWADPFYILESNNMQVEDLLLVPERTVITAGRDGWLTFIVNDAVISPYSPSEDGKVFYRALEKAKQAASHNRHQVPQILPLSLAFYADNLGAFRVNVTVYPIKS
ncbi:MAG TPA: toll/interleukin-1 receptor domain-containing protein [Candidatus Angelobacter sp.]|jgi:hypothetical protein|nr:toll/interleukin-1 receptor domain-containing protein [Candidatus Angelobacter sp.]